jgi:putative ATP-binding cassette transporter
MEKFWNYLRTFSPLKPLGAVGTFLDKTLDWLLWIIGKALMLLAPLGRLLLFFARLTRINRILNWADLVLVAEPYWNGDNRKKAYALTIATLFCMVANAKAAFYFGLQLKIINDIVNTPGSTDAEFFMAVGWLTGIGFAWALVNNGYGTFRSYLAIDWRIWQSNMYVRQYVKNEAYLRLNMTNTDQRMAQDPDVFANTTVWLAMILVETVVNLWTFFPVLYQSSKLLTVCCLGCAAVSYVAVLWLGRSLPKLTFMQYDSEATLRTYLQDGSRFGASIAQQRSEPLFLAQATRRLGAVRRVLVSVMKVNLYTSIYNFFAGQVVGNAALVGIGWLVMHGRATMGQIAQAGQAFTNVYNGLTVFTSQFGAFSTLKAELDRLGPFARALNDIGENRMPAGQWIEYTVTDGNTISLDKTTVFSSYLDPKPVVHEMTLTFDVDTLITGRDGHGKSDMARALGLGQAAGTGKITRPARDKIMYLPLALYMPTCTAREFLCDMQPSGPEDDQRLTTVLDLVGLHDLVERCKGESTGGLDTEQDWKVKISGPEQQKLCLARAILFKPAVLIIDQATDGFEAEIEEDIYKILRGLGIRLITFSNSSRLAKTFKRVIELREDRGFDQHDAQEYKVPGWKTFLNRLGGK